MNDPRRTVAASRRSSARPPALILCACLGSFALATATATAEPVGVVLPGDPVTRAATAASTTLLSESVLTRGSQSFSFDLRAPAAGTFEVRLSDLAWPERLASLSFSISSATGVLKTLQAPGLLTLEVGSAGAYFANVATRTQGALGVGLYSLDVRFAEGVMPIPLPGSAWLLMAAAAALAGLLHRGSGRLEAGAERVDVAARQPMPAGCPA